MNRNLHDIDEIFNEAHARYETEPSPAIWDRINADLTRKDAELYKRKYVDWRRVAIIMILLLSGFILHESGIITNRSARNNKQAVKEESVNEESAKEEHGQNNAVAVIRHSPIRAVADNKLLIIKKSEGITGEELPDELPAYAIISQPAMTERNVFVNIYGPALVDKVPIDRSVKRKAAFKPYWSVAGFVSSDRAKYALENDEEDINGQQPQNEKQLIASREQHEPSVSLGILLSRQFTKNMAVKTGLVYSYTAIGIKPQQIYATKKTDGTIAYKYNTSSGYGYIAPGFGGANAVGDSLRSAEAKHTLQSLSIPVLLSYRITKNKFSITPSAGITANFITKAKIETEVKDAVNRETVTINKLHGLRHFYAGLMANVDLQYNMKKQWAVNVSPAFKYAISPITKSNVVKTFPYSIGIATGIIYKF